MPISYPNGVTPETLANTVSGLQNQIDGLASHTHPISSITNLQTNLDSKADLNAVANTVSVLQQDIDTKAAVVHQHTTNSITDYPFNHLQESLAPLIDDFAIIQPFGSDNFQKVRIAKLQPDTQSLFNWQRVTSDSEMKLLTLVDASQNNITLSVPSNLVPGIGFELKKINSSNFVKINGIQKLNGQVIQAQDTIAFDDSVTDDTTRLVYVNEDVGWMVFPRTSFAIIKPLGLPINKLKQLFYAGNITASNDSLVSVWNDPISGLNASQNDSSKRPTLVSSVFANGGLPSASFENKKFLNVDCNWITNNRFTVCIVEKRKQHVHGVILNSLSSGGLQAGYSNTANFGFSKTSTGSSLSLNVGSFTVPITRIWIFSHSTQGWTLWLNGTRVAITTSTQQNFSQSGSTIGRDIDSGYVGDVGLIAFYEGNMTDVEIRAVSDAVNQTFKVY